MQDYEELVPDAEMFARVWKRVMPDEEASPIVVHRSGERRMQTPPPRQPDGLGDEARLRELLEQMDEGMARGREILRRDRGAWPLKESLDRSAAQLRAAWMLYTGDRWRSAMRSMPVPGRMDTLLREQYLWELRFSQLCREAGEKLTGADMAEIMPEQEKDSGRRRRMLRHMLAR